MKNLALFIWDLRPVLLKTKHDLRQEKLACLVLFLCSVFSQWGSCLLLLKEENIQIVECTCICSFTMAVEPCCTEAQIERLLSVISHIVTNVALVVCIMQTCPGTCSISI